jgi:hypothetical protein
MLLLIRVRAEARKLSHEVRKALLTERELWEIDADQLGRPILNRGRFRIALVPRRLRLLDGVHLFCNEVEVWLPLIARIRLRNAARFVIARFARDEWVASSAEPCRVPVRTTEEQPV